LVRVDGAGALWLYGFGRNRNPLPFETFFEDTILVERIREVRALLGFTRIESNADFTEATVLKDGRLTRLSRESPRWLRSEVRGEGIFLRLREEITQNWLARSY
jgi:hypothetical protein